VPRLRIDKLPLGEFLPRLIRKLCHRTSPFEY
jgi:hypothetical protein